jgi:hypothetical protein
MYTAEISRQNPSMFLFLLDQSGSMQDMFGGGNTASSTEGMASGASKAQGIADAINRILQNLCIKCAKEEGVRDYFHVGVIGYGTQVGPAFSGALAGKELVPISQVASTPARVETRSKKVSDGAGGLVDQEIRFPVWFDAVANGGTPMCAALQEARRIVQGWISQHPNGFPPIVVNLTDGESTDGEPTQAAAGFAGLASSDGSVLLFNLHASSQKQAPILFPNSDAGLPDQYAKLLFQMSTPLTPFMIDTAKKDGINATEGARGFAFNADLVTVIQFLDIGTRPSNLR